MRILRWHFALVLGAFLVHGSIIQAGIANGSFETGTFAPVDGNDTVSLNPGATNIADWTVSNAALAWIGPANPFGITASDGSFTLDLTGYHDSSPYGGVEQSVATTIGHSYLLTFDIGAATTGTTSGISATAGAASQVFTATATQDTPAWYSQSFTFIASSSSTLISLVGTQASNNGHYIGLDNVNLVDQGPTTASVPEPSMLAISGAFLTIFGAGAWRRRRATDGVAIES
jgi:hypothetical protein